MDQHYPIVHRRSQTVLLPVATARRTAQSGCILLRTQDSVRRSNTATAGDVVAGDVVAVDDGDDSAEAVVVNTRGEWAVNTYAGLAAYDSDVKSNHIRRHWYPSMVFPYPGPIPRDAVVAAVG